MIARSSVLFAIAAGGVFGQSPVPVKAGDPAPPIVWTRILRSGPADQTPGSFHGRVTVILFFPNVTSNASLVTQWNETIARFADKPINFVWVAAESEESLGPWLQEHPVNGWLLLDPKSDSARAYGVEIADAAIVGADGKLAGFTFMIPDNRQIDAVLDGRAVAISGDADDAQMDAILADRIVRLEAEPQRPPVAESKPNIPPSEEVHISASSTKGTAGSSGPDFWIQRGFDLRSILSAIYEKNPRRIVLPASLDNGERYDFVLTLPREEDQEKINSLVIRAIEKQFHVSMTVENRPMDVYVMTALDGKTPPAKTGDEAFGFSGGFMNTTWSVPEIDRPEGTPPTIAELRKAAADMLSGAKAAGSISNIAAANTTLEDFCRMLEEGLNRPVIDETNLQGVYDLSVHGDAQKPEEFPQMLRDQLGLVLTPARRDIEMVVVTPVSE